MSMSTEDYLFMESVINKIDITYIPEYLVSSVEVHRIDGTVECLDPEEVDEIINNEESFSSQGISSMRYTIDFPLVREIVEREAKTILKNALS